MTTFIDSNVVIALLNSAEPNHAWAVAELTNRKTQGPAIISDVVFSEISVAMKDIADVNKVIEEWGLERYSTKDEALFRAGKAFKEFRQKHAGKKTGVLPDFFIGADAEFEDVPLMTDNTRQFVTYFPAVTLIKPPRATPPAAS